MRVVVADDVLFTRAGLARLLAEAGCEVVGEANDLDSALRETFLHRPDVVVLDIRMPPTHSDEGLVAAARIGADLPGTGVLVLSSYVEPNYAMRLIDGHPEGGGICSRNESQTPPCSLTRCVGSSTASAWSTRRSSRVLSADVDAPTRCMC